MVSTLPRLLLFTAILLIIVFFIYIYPVAALLHLLIASAIFQTASYGASIILAGFIFYYLRTHSTSPILSALTHYGMGIGFIGFGITNLGLIADGIVAGNSQLIGIICVLLTTALSAKAIMNGRHLHVKRLRFTSPKITDEFSFAFISDVHLGSNPKSHLDKICDELAKLEAEALLIGGDLFDSSAFQLTDLASLKQLNKPIYYITGNHEYYVKHHETKIKALTDYNLQILDDEIAQMGEVTIIGIDDYHTPKEQALIAQKLVDKSRFNLVLVHQPAIWEQLPDEADLMLSGHTHNGQIVPFNWLVRLQFKAVYGLYHYGNAQAYVSSGAGTWGPRMRLGTQNEILQITLAPSGDK